MLALSQNEVECDRLAYGLAKKVCGSYSEVKIQYGLTVSRAQSFHSFGWSEGEGKGSFNWGANQGVGPAGSFLFCGMSFKCYDNIEQGLADFFKELYTRGVEEAVELGSILRACEAQNQSQNYFKAILEHYGKISQSLGWKKQLSIKINLWACALEKFYNGDWHPSVEYVRASSHHDAIWTIRQAYTNPMVCKIVDCGQVLGFKAEDRDGKILSV